MYNGTFINLGALINKSHLESHLPNMSFVISALSQISNSSVDGNLRWEHTILVYSTPVGYLNFHIYLIVLYLFLLSLHNTKHNV